MVLILILCLANQSLAGALVPRLSGKPQTNIFEQFWEKMNNFVTGGLHLVGSILPLRGLATIAKVPFIYYVSSCIVQNLIWLSKGHSFCKRSSVDEKLGFFVKTKEFLFTHYILTKFHAVTSSIFIF